MSIATFAIAALTGAALGFCFNILILFPAIVFAVLSVAGVGMVRSDQGSEVIVTAILIAAALQIGYFLGIIARAIVVLSWAPLVKRLACGRRPLPQGR